MRGVRSNLLGKRFDRLTVEAYIGTDNKGNSRWRCRCKCGATKDVSGKDLLSGNVRSCGCLAIETRKQYEDLTGRTFNKLYVERFDHITESGHTFWVCRCECGNTKICSGSKLKSGSIKSCGCLQKHIAVENGYKKRKIITSFGKFSASSHIVRSYLRMVRRCYDSTNASYKYYTSKNITVSQDWLPDGNYRGGINIAGAIQFIEDMYPSYCEHIKRYGQFNTTLDRIDGTKGYSKDNCRWATFVVQNNNLSSNRHIYDGEEILTFSECVRKYIPLELLSAAYAAAPSNIITTKFDRGWTVNQILAFLKHVKCEGVLLHKRDLNTILIRRIDQSVVYVKYPNEERMPGYK